MIETELKLKNCANKKCTQINPQLISEFNKNSKQNDGLQYYCKSCTSIKVKESQKQNPEKWAAYQRKSREKNPEKHHEHNKRYQKKYPERVRNTILKRNFGITVEQYDHLYSQQKGCCGICQKHSTEFKKRLAVDHCHKTGIVRKLLCHHCNTAIGLFEDNSEIILLAFNYLKDFE